jgi:hypothetical protein
VAKARAISASQRSAFLEVLARKANVTAAAKAGDITTAAAYRLRLIDAGFRAKWHAALCEGYARIETELVAEALKAPSALTSEAMLKARAQKERLRLALLSAHRAAVRGERTGQLLKKQDDMRRAKMDLVDELDVMAERSAAVSVDGTAAAGA